MCGDRWDNNLFHVTLGEVDARGEGGRLSLPAVFQTLCPDCHQQSGQLHAAADCMAVPRAPLPLGGMEAAICYEWRAVAGSERAAPS